MYAAVDIGGTKTLVAVFTESGKIKEQIKFPTPQNYDEFLRELAANVDKLSTKDFQYGCVAIPGRVNRELGTGLAFGNLPWLDVPLLTDCERILQCPFLAENDAKLAGLSEANLLAKKYKKVLYVTISTGIGIALTVNGKINKVVGDGGGGAIFVEHNGKLVLWESFASGKAIVEEYGMRASEIDDPDTWRAISHHLAPGLLELIAVITPDAIVIGGGVGSHFDKFGKFLNKELKQRETPMLPIPPIIAAKRPEEAVVYGCYDLIKAHRGQLA